MSLSEQQLIDCETKWSMGCKGGSPIGAFIYYMEQTPIRESDYPYTSSLGNDSTDCLYDPSKISGAYARDLK